MARSRKSPLYEWLEASPRDWVLFLAALAGLAIGLWAFARFIAWMRDDEDNAAAEQMMLTQYTEMHRDGDLSEEEYRSIKGRLLERLGDPEGSATAVAPDDVADSSDDSTEPDSDVADETDHSA